MIFSVDLVSRPDHVIQMRKIVNIAEAKSKLSALLDDAMSGQEIVIARAGRPLVRLVPVEGRRPREPGLARDLYVPDDLFLEPADPEELDAAEGRMTDEFGVSRPA